MQIFRTYRTELDPSASQRSQLARHTGVARWAYNWGLEQSRTAIAAGRSRPTAIDLHRRLNKLKHDTYPWLYDVSKCAPQEALRDLDRAFLKAAREPGRGLPRFKRRREGLGSFRLNDPVRIEASHIRLPRVGRVRLKEKNYLPADAHILSSTVSWHAGKWFVSVRVRDNVDPLPSPEPPVGLDLGIVALGMTSEGIAYCNPRALRRLGDRSARLQRAWSRARAGSRRRRRLQGRIRRLHYHIANVRHDAIHKMTTRLTRSKSAIVIEDLKVSWMVKHPTLGGSIRDASFGEIRRQLEYKAIWYGSRLVVAPRFYPSSRTCSHCGALRLEKLPLAERMFRCADCGAQLDRDLNAARNLLRVAVSSTETENGPQSGALSDTALKREPGMPRASTENGGTTSRSDDVVGYNLVIGTDREE